MQCSLMCLHVPSAFAYLLEQALVKHTSAYRYMVYLLVSDIHLYTSTQDGKTKHDRYDCLPVPYVRSTLP